MATITVKQFGFSTGAGVLSNLVDKDRLTFWQPLATHLDTITDQFLLSDGTLNYGGSFAALEWDFGVAVRAQTLLINVESALTLGDAVLVGSNNPATSIANTLQTGDVKLATFSPEQIVQNKTLAVEATIFNDLRFRYYRLLQRSSNPSAGPTVDANSSTFDTAGAAEFETPAYTDKFIIEMWGAGACAGVAADSNDGGDSTCSTYSLTAGGGNKPSATNPNLGTGTGTGGVATGGNNVNTPGGDAPLPSPTSIGEGLSGAGGSAPNGGLGGDGVPNNALTTFSDAIKAGRAGVAPGGGGSGRNWAAGTGGGSYFKYPGGGAGSYVKHVLTKGIDGPDPGDMIDYVVGAGGVPSNLDGRGANGRVRFSWT